MTVTLAIAGAGSRGSAYARYAEHFPDRATVVAVADPRPEYLDALADRHGLPDTARFAGWAGVAATPRLADAIVLATPDREHAEATVAFAGLGYDILLEKPMAPTEAGCEAVEPVGWWHFAHSFVRGNWRRADESSSSLLAKCCHDLDWLRYIVDAPPVSVSSVGALHHFHPGERPAGASDRCLDCAIEPACPYSASRLYTACLADPDRHDWPLSVVTREITPAGLHEALRDGPYGRCVYASDNDVVDHQVVTATFERGVTATLTMSAFTPGGHRRTRVMGTRGHLEGDGERVTLTDFVTGRNVHCGHCVWGRRRRRVGPRRRRLRADGRIRCGGRDGRPHARAFRPSGVARQPPDGLRGRAEPARRWDARRSVGSDIRQSASDGVSLTVTQCQTPDAESRLPMPPPDPPSLDAAVLLVARLRALMGDIAQTRRLLESIPDTLRGAVDARVGTALHRLERRLARIRDGETAEHAWAHVHVLALELAELGDESLALAAGALLRGAGADHGACAYADRLIAEILARTPLPWSSFTVPATEAYYVRKTQVVRVRVGAAWFWELPVAAHELGHYAGPAISYEAGGTTIHPVERMLDRARTTQPVSWSWLNEIFADVFAVWTVGPAYALACVFDRFEPIYSDEGTDTHPAASVRVAVLRRVLDHLDAEAYATVGVRLDTAWQAMRAASGAKPASDEDIALATGWCDEVLDLLDEHLLLARWDGWWRARQLATDLAGSGVVATAGHDMRTVLNGGWLARLDGGDEVDTRVRALAAAVVGGTDRA